MQLADLERFRRCGSIQTGGRDLLDELVRLSGAVKGRSDDGIEWRWLARSPIEAAAWLLVLSHNNACLDEAAIAGPKQITRNMLLVYRGQAVKYKTLVPTKWRSLDDEQRQQHYRASRWLHAIVQLWLEKNFRWAGGGPRRFKLDYRDSEAISQHYGYGTTYIDWSWDPLNAIAFGIGNLASADRGSRRTATVLIRTLSKESQDQVILPPTFAQRIWKQRGCFQAHSAPPEVFDHPDFKRLGIDGIVRGRVAAKNYPRITFRVDDAAIEWAVQRRDQEMLADPGPLPRLAEWAQYVAQRTDVPPPDSLVSDPDRERFLKEIKKRRLEMPVSIREGENSFVEEDIDTVMAYANAVALRIRGDQYGYDKAALVIFGEGVGGSTSLGDHGKPLPDREGLPIVARAITEPSVMRSEIFLANPKIRCGPRVRPWNRDGYEKIDLFVPVADPCRDVASSDSPNPP